MSIASSPKPVTVAILFQHFIASYPEPSPKRWGEGLVHTVYICVKNPGFIKKWILRVYSCHLVEKGIMSDMQFAMAVAHTLSWIGKMGIMLKSEQAQATPTFSF